MNNPVLNVCIGGKDIARLFVSVDSTDLVVVDILYLNEGKIRFMYPESRIADEVVEFLRKKHGAEVDFRKSKPAEARDYEKLFRAKLKNSRNPC